MTIYFLNLNKGYWDGHRNLTLGFLDGAIPFRQLNQIKYQITDVAEFHIELESKFSPVLNALFMQNFSPNYG